MLPGGDVQRCHGDGDDAVRAAECLVHGTHASSDQRVGVGVTSNA